MNTTTRRIPPKRYQHLFLGYYFSCNNFGHKELNFISYGKYNYKNVQIYGYKNNKNSNNQEKKNYNLFYPLQNYMLYDTNATIMVTYLVIVDYQNIP
jgi:hypothetical protein